MTGPVPFGRGTVAAGQPWAAAGNLSTRLRVLGSAATRQVLLQQERSSSVQSAQHSRGHETAQPWMQMRKCCRACRPSASAARGLHFGGQLATLLTEPAARLGRPALGAGRTAGAWSTTANAVADVITYFLQTDSPHRVRPLRCLQPAQARRPGGGR